MDDTIKQIRTLRNRICRARGKVRRAADMGEKMRAMKTVQQLQQQLARIDNTYN